MNLPDIRNAYAEAVQDRQTAEWLLSQLSNAELNDPLWLAYRGAAEAIMASHVTNPFTKLGYVGKFGQSLAKAVTLAPESAEIRFLRFSVQHNLPAFLNASKHLAEDKAVIMKHLDDPAVEATVRQTIAAFLLESGGCTPEETRQLEAILK